MSEQAQEQSLADRIANQFEVEDSQEPQEEPQEEQVADTENQDEQPEETGEELVPVEFNGKSYSVPSELKSALMAQSDYTKKTQEVADLRKNIDFEKEQYRSYQMQRDFDKSVNDDITTMQKLDYTIEQYKEIDVTGLSSDQLWLVSRQIDALKEKREQLSKGVSEKYNSFRQEQGRLAEEIKQKSLDVISKTIPNYNDSTRTQIRSYAESLGFDSKELDVITDPRVVKVLWQASQYQKLQGAKNNGQLKTVPAVKPGSSNQMPQAVKEKFAFKKAMSKTNNSAAKAKLIEAELMKRF